MSGRHSEIDSGIPRVGLEITDWMDLEVAKTAAATAESRGFSDILMAEVGDPDAFITAALVLEQTKQSRFCTCIAQIGPRSIPMLAMSAATISSLYPDRFGLGIGISSEAIIRGWHGVAWDRPLARAEEAVCLLREILSGARTDFDGRVLTSKGFRLNRPPAHPPPIHLAALNERMLRLAGRVADGVWLNFVPRSRLSAVVSIANEEAALAGRPEPEVLLSVACCITDDVGSAREELRSVLTFYATSAAYRRMWAWHGFAEEMRAAEEAWSRRDRQGLRATITDELIDSVALIGQVDDVKRQLMTYRDSGLSTLGFGPTDDQSLEAVLGELSPSMWR